VNQDQASAIVKHLLASYPTQRQRMSADDVRGMVLAYSAGLLDLDADSTRRAVDALVKTSEWLPTVAKIRSRVVDVGNGRARKTGGEAWGEVLALISRYGVHRTPGVNFEISDPLVARAVKSFGWRNLCSSEGDSIVADRARFIALFDQLATTSHDAQAVSIGAAAPALAAGDSPFAAALRLVPGGDDA
jgi:hypothetical protein